MTVHVAQRKQETKLFWDTLKIVGLNIKTKRVALGWSTRQFAERIGLVQSSVVWVENGRKRVPLTWIVNAAEALDVPVQLLFVPAAFGPPPPASPQLKSSRVKSKSQKKGR